jgi:phage terminase large subunit GpA-like protein
MADSSQDGQVGRLLSSLARGLRPEKLMWLDEWADKYLESPIFKGGRFSTSMTPYARQIMRWLSPQNPTQRVTLMMATQLVKTTIGVAWLAYVVYYGLGPFIHVRTKLAAAREFVDERIKPLWRLPCLAGKVAKAGGRDKAGRKLYTEFEGGFFNACGSHNADDVAAKTALFGWQDEVDREAASAKSSRGDEGPAHLLLPKRLSVAGARAKLLYTSSPTTEAGPINQLYLEGSQAQYYVPCPHCGEMQVLLWPHVRWEGDPRGPLSEIDCWYECAACHQRIDEWQKTAMFAEENGARWIEKYPDRPDKSVQLSTLYAPAGGRSWKDLAKAYCYAVDSLRMGDPEPMKVFKQTDMAEPWEYVGEAEVPTNVLMSRREIWPRDAIPIGVVAITAGVDTQDDRLEMHVMGWGLNREKYTLDYTILHSADIDDTLDGRDEFDILTELRRTPYRRADGRVLSISLTVIDVGGHRADVVHDYVRQFSSREIVATIGATRRTAPTVDRREHKSERHNGKFRYVNTHAAKTALLPSLAIAKPIARSDGDLTDIGAPGYWHFPIADWCDDEFFLQLTAEHRVRPKGAFDDEFVVWEKHRARNEVLDTAAGAYIALRILIMEKRLAGIIRRNCDGAPVTRPASEVSRSTKLPHTEPASPRVAATPTGPGPVRLSIGGRTYGGSYPGRY